MKILRYTVLFLILCNMPSYLLAYFSPTLGTLSSYASTMLLIGFYILAKEKHKPCLPFIILGLLYFTLSSLNLSGYANTEFIKDLIRFMIVAFCAVEVVSRTNRKELFVILLIGASSIIINAFIFPFANANFYPTYGRYSGFYLNPNFAGTICLAGYALVYAIDNKRLRIAGQILFTLGGILTFSRSFLVIWLIINLLSVVQNKKNIIVLVGGLFFFVIFLVYSSGLNFNAERFGALKGILTDEASSSEVLSEDSRTETWSLYLDMIADKPFLGNGYKKFQTKNNGLPGVHNTYLMVLGEAGIIPFALILLIYFWMVRSSFKLFRFAPDVFYLACVLSIALLVGHGYFRDFYNILLSMFVFVQLREFTKKQLATY